ncbi:MerR family transcriptional regulator [Kitasatospora sp. NPDC092039]|uniref:MerR family transcriptional regulator n=1 Tax=Kitasatospora sp. NPDC092039 TaxID=3364086 RepID=UPI00382FB368
MEATGDPPARLDRKGQPVPPEQVSEDRPGLPTGEVARQLGVSPVTLRSWERRYGIGPVLREPGGHRRWTGADIERLRRMCRLTASGVPPAQAAHEVLADDRAGGDVRPPAGGPSPGGPSAGGPPGRLDVRGLCRAARRLDAAEVAEVLERALARHGVLWTWEQVMAPALRATGGRWAAAGAGEGFVEVEHLLSWQVGTALRRVAPVPSVPGPGVLLAAVAGEQHCLALDALAAALAERATAYRMLGADVPGRAVLTAVERTGPAAVVLWSQMAATADPELARLVAAGACGAPGARHRPAVVLGGPGWRRTRVPMPVARPRDLRGCLAVLAEAVGGRGAVPGAGGREEAEAPPSGR